MCEPQGKVPRLTTPAEKKATGNLGNAAPLSHPFSLFDRWAASVIFSKDWLSQLLYMNGWGNDQPPTSSKFTSYHSNCRRDWPSGPLCLDSMLPQMGPG